MPFKPQHKATFPLFSAGRKALEVCASAQWGTRSCFAHRAACQPLQKGMFGWGTEQRSSSLDGMTLCCSVPAVSARTSAPCGLVSCAKKPLPEAGNFQPLHHVFSLNCGLSSVVPVPNSHLGTAALARSCICCQ